ncbi:protein BCCIP homolog [Bemisia tabaci]
MTDSEPKVKKSKLSSGDGPGSSHEEQEVVIDFVGRSPEEDDVEGITQLLVPLFHSSGVDLPELVKLIIEQKNVGSVIKEDESIEENQNEDEDDEDDEDNIFGLNTVLDLTKNKESQCTKQLRKFILSLAKDHAEDYSAVESLLSNDTSAPVGLIINERFINIPPQISVPLFESLSKEIKGSDELSDFKHFVMICKIYKPSKRKVKSKPEKEASGILWSNAEEELINEEAEIKFEYPINDEIDSAVGGSWLEKDEAMITYRRLITFPASKLNSIIEKIKSSLSYVCVLFPLNVFKN